MTQASERRGFLVSGRVQGVGFRWAACRRGEELGLRGSARNRPDGTVEVHAEGTAEALVQLARWLASGPPGASVDAVQESPSQLPIPERGFQIVRGGM